MDLVVRRPYPSIDAWLREEAHLFSAERAWLVGVDAPPGTTAHLTIGLKGDDPLIEAMVIVDGVAGDFNGQPLLSVRWLELDAGAIETLHSLLRVDFNGAAPPSDLMLPPLSSARVFMQAPEPSVIDLEGMADSIKSEPHFALDIASADVVESAPRQPSMPYANDPLERLRSRGISAENHKSIVTHGRHLRTGGSAR